MSQTEGRVTDERQDGQARHSRSRFVLEGEPRPSRQCSINHASLYLVMMDQKNTTNPGRNAWAQFPESRWVSGHAPRKVLLARPDPDECYQQPPCKHTKKRFHRNHCKPVFVRYRTNCVEDQIQATTNTLPGGEISRSRCNDARLNSVSTAAARCYLLKATFMNQSTRYAVACCDLALASCRLIRPVNRSI